MRKKTDTPMSMRAKYGPSGSIRFRRLTNETWVMRRVEAAMARRPSKHGKWSGRLPAGAGTGRAALSSPPMAVSVTRPAMVWQRDAGDGDGRQHDDGGLGRLAEALVAVRQHR